MRVAATEITMANAGDIAAAGVAAIQSGDTTIDLGAVTRCDSSAVAAMLAWQRVAAAKKLQLQVLGGPRGLGSLASVYGVDELLPTLSSR